MRWFASPLSFFVFGVAACGGPQSNAIDPNAWPAAIQVLDPPRPPVWTPEQRGDGNRAIAGRGDEDVWVVGGPKGFPKNSPWLIHWDGKRWSEVQAPPSAPPRIEGVDVDDSGTVWIVGRDFVASRALGSTTWQEHAVPALPDPKQWCCVGVRRLGNEGWFVGNDVVIHDTSTGFVVDPAAPFGVFGAPHDLYGVKGDDYFHSDGASWTKLPRPQAKNGSSLYGGGGIWGTAGHGFWVAMTEGTMAYWNGSSWRTSPGPASVRCHAMDGVGMDDIWCAGVAGRSAYFDGKEWSLVAATIPDSPFAPQRYPIGIYATKRHVWLVVLGGTLWRLDR